MTFNQGVVFIQYLSLYAKEILVCVAVICVILSARFFYLIGQSGETKGKEVIRKSVYQSWRFENEWLKQRYSNDRERELFESVSSFKWLDEVRYKFLRDVLIGTSLIYFHMKWIVLGGSYPIIGVILTVLLYITLLLKKGFPAYRVMNLLAEQMRMKKNREIFMLYSLLLNEYALSGSKVANIYSILRKFKGHFTLIEPAINLALFYWKKGPTHQFALEAFAKEVSTDAANDLAKILSDIDTLSSQEAYTLLQNRHEYFNNLRIEEYRRRSKDRSLLGYMLVYIPSFAVIYNFCYIYYLEYKELMDLVNSGGF